MTIGRETVIVVNEQYRTVAKLNAHPRWNIDGHDISIIGNDAWVPVYRTAKHQDLARPRFAPRVTGSHVLSSRPVLSWYSWMPTSNTLASLGPP